MNRIYKGIWNEVLVTLAAVPEFVKGKVKIFLTLSQPKSLEKYFLVNRIFSQIFNQSTLVAVMNSFTKVAWAAIGIFINHELENGILHLTGFKGGVYGRKYIIHANASESAAKASQLLYPEHIPFFLGAIREC